MDPFQTIDAVRAFIFDHSAGIWIAVAMGVVSLFALLWSLRELLCWFLKVPSLENQIKDLREQVENIKSLLEGRSPVSSAFSSPSPSPSPSPQQATTKPLFSTGLQANKLFAKPKEESPQANQNLGFQEGPRELKPKRAPRLPLRERMKKRDEN